MGLSTSLQTVQVEKAIKGILWKDGAIILHNLIISMATLHLCYVLLIKIMPAIQKRRFYKNTKTENLGPWGQLGVSPASHHLLLINNPTTILPSSHHFLLSPQQILLLSKALSSSSSRAFLQKAHPATPASYLWSFL